MAKYQEQKPISEVLQERRASYEGRVHQAFDAVYQSVDLRRLEEFETAITTLCSSTQAGLESRVAQEQPEPQRVDRRPKLNSDRYKAARDAGMTNEQIKAKFRTDSPYSMGGFGRAYAVEKKQENLIETNPADERKLLTYKLYMAARDSGESNKDIAKKYRGEYPRQVNVFSMNYAKQKRREADRMKPELTYEAYATAKDAGQTNDQIRERFRLKCGLQLNGFAGNYAKHRKAGPQTPEAQ